jgi:hypothetical protein
MIRPDPVVQCQSCGWTGPRKSLLVAVNPFDAEDRIFGCPECKQCTDGFDQLCYIEGCTKTVCCGFPTTAHGYLFTCHEHSKEYNTDGINTK